MYGEDNGLGNRLCTGVMTRRSTAISVLVNIKHEGNLTDIIKVALMLRDGADALEPG